VSSGVVKKERDKEPKFEINVCFCGHH